MQPGEVLSEAWALYKAHWRHFLPLAFVVFLAISLISLVLALLLGWIGAVFATLIGFVGIFWLQGALCEAVADVLSATGAPISRSRTRSRRFAPA